MKDADLDKWTKTRAKGMWSFVLKIGVSMWGGFMFLFFVIGLAIAKELDSRMLLINAVTWVVAGTVFGLAVWWIGERNYRQELAKRSANERRDRALHGDGG